MMIYVVCSIDNDECSLNNKAFLDYHKAWAHAKEVEKNNGCEMKMLRMEFEDDV